MNTDLEKLIRLQEAEDAIGRVEAALDAIPRNRKELDAQLEATRAALDAARAAQEAAQKSRRQHEAALQDLETRRSKYKGQLMEVKTNKEYTAMLHEIEGVEREIRSVEDLILAHMEAAETHALGVKQEEARFREAQKGHQAESQVLESEARRLETERAKHRAERDALAATLPDDALALFRRVAKLRGAGVAEAKDGRCQRCNMLLRPQMYVDLKKNEIIMQCPSCSRILYFDTPAPTVEPPL